MNNLKRSIPVLLALCVAAPVGTIYAHDHDKGSRGERHENFDQMKNELKLSEDQLTKLKTLRESQKAAMKPLREKKKELVNKLEDQLKKNATDKDLEVTLNEIKANRQAAREQMEQFHAQREAILTPTQRAKMMLSMKRHFGGRRGMEKA